MPLVELIHSDLFALLKKSYGKIIVDKSIKLVDILELTISPNRINLIRYQKEQK